MTEKECYQKLVRDGYITSAELLNAFLRVPRIDFVEEQYKDRTGENIPLPTAIPGIYISQPSTGAFLLEILNAKKGEKILIVGCGTGWLAGVVSALVSSSEDDKNSGVVCAVEQNEDAANLATKNLEKHNFISKGVVHVHNGNWNDTYNEFGLYDSILVLRKVPEITDNWKSMIRIGGKIIAPIGEMIVCKEKIDADSFQTKQFFGFDFPEM